MTDRLAHLDARLADLDTHLADLPDRNQIDAAVDEYRHTHQQVDHDRHPHPPEHARDLGHGLAR